MELKYFRVIIACGHVGKGNSIEVARYFEAFDMLECYISAFWMPRSKKKTGCVKLVQQITFDEYHSGKITEQSNLYLQHRSNSKIAS